MKRYKFLILLFVLLTMFGNNAYSIAVDNEDGVTIYYNYYNGGTELQVTYGSYSGNVVIPSSVTYNGKTYSVTSIFESAFSQCSNLTSVTIPSSVKSIGWHAFSCCSRDLKMTMNLRDAHISIDAFSGFNDWSDSRGVNRQGFKYEKDGTCTFDGRPIGDYSDTSN